MLFSSVVILLLMKLDVSKMANFDIEYCFTFENDKREVIEVSLDAEICSNLVDEALPLPDWTRLEFYQCSHCPLESNTKRYCPLAIQLSLIIPIFEQASSFDKVNVLVTSVEREIRKTTTVQRAVSSLMGLMIATSGCPFTQFFRPMARFHLPFCSEEETLYRAVSSYLLAQYYQNKRGVTPDLELSGLKQVYLDMQKVNRSIVERLKAASNTDSSTNAIVLLDLYAKAAPYVIEDSLEDLRYLFKSYLN